MLQRRPLEPGTRRAGVWRGGPGGATIDSVGAMAVFPENLLLLWSLRFRCLNWRPPRQHHESGCL